MEWRIQTISSPLSPRGGLVQSSCPPLLFFHPCPIIILPLLPFADHLSPFTPSQTDSYGHVSGIRISHVILLSSLKKPVPPFLDLASSTRSMIILMNIKDLCACIKGNFVNVWQFLDNIEFYSSLLIIFYSSWNQFIILFSIYWNTW